MSYKLAETTIRDFGGGWDVSDSDKALGSKYQPVSDNVVRETDGSFTVRPGYKLFADMKMGSEFPGAPVSAFASTVSGTGIIKITQNFHGMASGNHANITAWTPTIAGITQADIIGVHGVDVIDGNNFNIYVRKNANATVTNQATTITYARDTNILGGRDIFGRYFSDHLVVFSDTGEIVKINKSGVVSALWNLAIAQGLTTPQLPWGPCRRISAEIIKGRLIAVNGATNDKPLEILPSGSSLTCNYLLDGPGGGNTSLPRADFIIAADRYALYISTERGPTKVDVTAKDTYNVTDRNSVPDDAREIDLGMVTQSVETTILGANVIRSRVFIAFHDRSQLGELGIYTTDTVPKHDPDFKDNVALFGSFSHQSIVSLGNDLFCTAITGINSLALSASSGEFQPSSISELIQPVLQRHLGRLSEDDRRYRTFAVWDMNYRSYMLFAPKYSAVADELPDDPIIVSTTLQPNSLALVSLPSHTYDAGDYITISGITASPDGLIPAATINGKRRIRAVVDENTLAVEVGAYPPGLNYNFGGVNGFSTPVNDETPAYVFEYNSRLKIRRWTRFRGLNFDWGAVSQLSQLYFGKDGRVYRFGSAQSKYTADKIGDYTRDAWFNSTTYSVGDRVLDSTYRAVFLCTTTHTSRTSGTFKQDRDAHPTWWTPWVGYPINWELETSWTDFKDRIANKQIELVRFDTKGASEFEFSIYTNSIREDFETFELIPRRTTVMIGQDAPGWGGGPQPFGGGRNTRQEWLRGMPVEGKLFRLRFAGASVKPLTISSATMYYHKTPTALT